MPELRTGLASLALSLPLFAIGTPLLLAQDQAQVGAAEQDWVEKFKRHFDQHSENRPKISFRVTGATSRLALKVDPSRTRITRTCSIPLLTGKPDERGTARRVQPPKTPNMPNVDPPAPPCEDWN